MRQPVTRSEIPLSLKQWAVNNRIAYRTAWRMFRAKRLPESLRAEQLPTGTIRLYPIDYPCASEKCSDNDRVMIYARIHPRQPREELEAQVETCKAFCFARGWMVGEIVREIASATSLKRCKLERLIEKPPSHLVVLTPTVLSRFDYVILEKCLRGLGCCVTVIDESTEIEGSGGALEDLVDAVSLTARLHYGQKRGALLLESLKKLLRGNLF